MKVWIEQDACTGDGLCVEKSPAMFQVVEGMSHVRDHGTTMLLGTAMAEIPDVHFDDVLDAAEDCPGECIFIEA